MLKFSDNADYDYDDDDAADERAMTIPRVFFETELKTALELVVPFLVSECEAASSEHGTHRWPVSSQYLIPADLCACNLRPPTSTGKGEYSERLTSEFIYYVALLWTYKKEKKILLIKWQCLFYSDKYRIF